MPTHRSCVELFRSVRVDCFKPYESALANSMTLLDSHTQMLSVGRSFVSPEDVN